jgi:hypothetical protein
VRDRWNVEENEWGRTLFEGCFAKNVFKFKNWNV